MSIPLLLLGRLMFLLLLVSWRHGGQRHTGKMSSNSTARLLVRPSPVTESANNNVANRLTVIRLSRDTLTNSWRSVIVDRVVLVNLRLVEYDLPRLERLVVTTYLNGTLVNRKPTGQADGMC